MKKSTKILLISVLIIMTADLLTCFILFSIHGFNSHRALTEPELWVVMPPLSVSVILSFIALFNEM